MRRKAGTAFEQLYTDAGGKIDGVVSANDTMAGGIIARLKANSLNGKVPVTGQDASDEGLNAILVGDQCMTVFKNTDLEAQAAAALAIALIKDDGSADDLITGEVEDTVLKVKVQSSLATPEMIFKNNVGDVIETGFTTAAKVTPVLRLRSARSSRSVSRSWGAGLGRAPHLPAFACRPPASASEVYDDDSSCLGVGAPAPPAGPLLSLRGVNKSFGAVQVLREVDFHASPGMVTALVGDNGAGKTTLIKGIAGIYGFDSGEFYFGEEPVHIQARRRPSLGIEVVYQDLALCDNLDIVQNLFLGSEKDRLGKFSRGAMEAQALETLQGCGCDGQVDPAAGATLSGGQRQTVAIARAVLWNSKLVILDEPTAALGVAQTEQVLRLVRRLATTGSRSS